MFANAILFFHLETTATIELLVFQAQSQGSITLKIIPAIKEEDHLKDSKVREVADVRKHQIQSYIEGQTSCYLDAVRDSFLGQILGLLLGWREA